MKRQKRINFLKSQFRKLSTIELAETVNFFQARHGADKTSLNVATEILEERMGL